MGRLRILAVLLLMTGSFSELCFAASIRTGDGPDGRYNSRPYNGEYDGLSDETSDGDISESSEEEILEKRGVEVTDKGLRNEKRSSELSDPPIDKRNVFLRDVQVTEDEEILPGEAEISYSESVPAKVREAESKLPSEVSEVLQINYDSLAKNSEIYTRDTPEVLQTEEDRELSNPTNNVGETDIRQVNDDVVDLDLTGEDAFYSEKKERQASEKGELEELEQVAPLSSGNKLEIEIEAEDPKRSVQETQAEMTATEASEVAPTPFSSLSNAGEEQNEDVIQQESSSTIILDSNVDVENSVAKRRSPLLPSARLDELEESPTNDVVSELKDERDVEPSVVKKRLLDEDIDPCNQPVVTGSCNGSFARFYFSPQARSCLPFTYTGCGQNSNNFGSAEDCLMTCDPHRNSRHTEENKPKKKIEFGSSAFGTGIYSRNRIRRKFPLVFCSLELDVGEICPNLKRGLYLEQFFYDTRIGQCAPFVYSGCGGNSNRFSSMWECTQNCVTSGSADILPK